MELSDKVAVAAQAWDKVKPADDPAYNQCALSHKEFLLAQVEAVERTGSASNPFEKAVKEILDVRTAEMVEAQAQPAEAESTAGAVTEQEPLEPEAEPVAEPGAEGEPVTATRSRKATNNGGRKHSH